jgi:hypothetical protein
MANKSGASKESQAATYKTSKRWETNRLAKLLRAQKNHPNNEQIAAALKNIRYRRKTPTNQVWNSSRRRIAMLMKEFKGVCHPEIFSTNEKVSVPALILPGPFSVATKTKSTSDFGMFTLEARAVVKTGVKF